MPWFWSYTRVSRRVGVGINPGSSGRAAGALNRRASRLSSPFHLYLQCLIFSLGDGFVFVLLLPLWIWSVLLSGFCSTSNVSSNFLPIKT